MEEKVLLRAMEPEDLDVLYQIENNAEMWGIGPTNVPYSRYTLHDYIATSADDIYADRQVRLMVDYCEETVGIVDIVNFDPKNLRAEVGVAIMRRHRRKGCAVSALRQVVDYARRVLHLHQLYAFVPTDNLPSVELFRKAGFNTTQEMKDWLFDGRSFHQALLMQIFL